MSEVGNEAGSAGRQDFGRRAATWVANWPERAPSTAARGGVAACAGMA